MDTAPDLLARTLIEVFAAALRDLGEGKPIPAGCGYRNLS